MYPCICGHSQEEHIGGWCAVCFCDEYIEDIPEVEDDE